MTRRTDSESDPEASNPESVKPKPDGAERPSGKEEFPGDRQEEAEGTAPRKKKRKKRRQALDAEGRERPRFLLGFPKHPELDKLSRAFEAGNYAHVRKHAPSLIEQAEDPRVREAAEELQKRIQPDPLAKYILAISIALLIFLIIYAYGFHQH